MARRAREAKALKPVKPHLHSARRHSDVALAVNDPVGGLDELRLLAQPRVHVTNSMYEYR
jgi:hypothetical protein